jgi:hypothetical protein
MRYGTDQTDDFKARRKQKVLLHLKYIRHFGEEVHAAKKKNKTKNRDSSGAL